jgi:hypothetical protein
MDAAADNTIELDYNLNSGSGSGDLFAYIKNSLFTGATYVTLYSQFGDPPGANNNNDGFEEWAVRSVEIFNPPVPEPASMLMWAFGIAAAGSWRLRKFAAAR